MDHLWELREELSEHNDTVGATTDAVYTQESFVNAFNLVCHEDKMTEEEQLLRYTTGTSGVTFVLSSPSPPSGPSWPCSCSSCCSSTTTSEP